MKLNSKKKNSLGNFWISIFFILVFYLFFTFFGDSFNKKILSFKKNIDIYFLDKEKIVQENLILKKEIKKINLKNIFANYYYNRTKKLEERINFTEENNKKRQLFSVIFQKNKSIYDSIILKNNFKKEVKKEDKVFFSENFVIGKISGIEKNIIKVKSFFNLGVKENYLIIQNGEIFYKGIGVGDSSGLIKLKLPRDLETDNNAILVLDDDQRSIVGVFLKDNFKSQKTEREVFFKVFYNPNTLMEVEI